ncbi:MAG: thioredoxin domain-containing protein [Bdellovibrionaceae bacterium]|nr:thioredoxin domain-containing protein [Pseudobdellovibrionaceae bacterium]
MAPQQDVSPQVHGSKTWFYIALVAVLAAIGVHGYLTHYHLELKYGLPDPNSICNVSSTFSCDAAAASRFSEFMGVPLALWGAVTNFVLLGMALLFPLTENSRKAAARTNILLFSGFIAAVSVVMGAISLMTLTRYCPFCILTYVLSFIALAGFWRGLPAAGKGMRFSLSDTKALWIAGGVILVGSFILNSGIRRNFVQDPKGFEQSLKVFVREWSTSPQMSLEPVAPLVKGNPDPNAKMTIVEFADFRCGHCKAAAPTLDAFVKAHPDARLIFQTWPLDGECNSAIPHANNVSCALARAFVCAHQKDKGWPAHDWIFAHQEQLGGFDSVMRQMTDMAQELGINADELKTCMDSEDTRKTVKEQAELGVRLNIQGTPSIFVNGKQLTAGQSLPVLRAVYEKIMNEGK